MSVCLFCLSACLLVFCPSCVALWQPGLAKRKGVDLVGHAPRRTHTPTRDCVCDWGVPPVHLPKFPMHLPRRSQRDPSQESTRIESESCELLASCCCTSCCCCCPNPPLEFLARHSSSRPRCVRWYFGADR